MLKIFIYPIYLDEEFDLNQLIKNDSLQSFALHFFIHFMSVCYIAKDKDEKVTPYSQTYSLISIQCTSNISTQKLH